MPVHNCQHMPAVGLYPVAVNYSPELYEMMVRVQHDCPWTRFTQKQPRLKMALWCNDHTDILEVECPDVESFETTQNELSRMSEADGTKILEKTVTQESVQFVAKTCSCPARDIDDLIEANNCVQVYPTLLAGGWEQYRVISFKDEDLRNLLKAIDRIGKAEVVYKGKLAQTAGREAFSISVNSLFGKLTKKQAEALLAALESGYYAVPKRVTTGQLAKRYRVPRSTFEEHVRKAESKVLRALVPFMMLSHAGPSQALGPTTG